MLNDVFEHALRDVDDSDTVGIRTQNQVNQNDKPIGIGFRRKDRCSGDVTRSIFERVSQSNSRFIAPGHVSRNRPFGQDARPFR